MRLRSTLFITLVLALPALGCGKGSSSSGGAGVSPSGTTEATGGAEAPSITVPTDGTASERVRALWKQTEAMIVADWDANLPYEDAQVKAKALTTAWNKLQVSISGQQPFPDHELAAVTEAMASIDRFYGDPSYAHGAEKYAEKQQRGHGAATPDTTFSLMRERLGQMP